MAGCDGWAADPTPNWAALAGDGNGGVEAESAVADRAPETCDFAPSDFPGRIAETSAAKPAVRAAAATMIHRRVRLIRCSAASRNLTESTRTSPRSCVDGMAVWCPFPLREK
jgi:hypothetical protein